MSYDLPLPPPPKKKKNNFQKDPATFHGSHIIRPTFEKGAGIWNKAKRIKDYETH